MNRDQLIIAELARNAVNQSVHLGEQELEVVKVTLNNSAWDEMQGNLFVTHHS